MKLGRGIADDLKARLPWYASDWKEGFQSGIRILAPSVYIFFASLIPGLAFGEQIDHDTHGAFNGSHVLVATAIGGVAQAFVGGQPLLILGVAEPTVLMYGFMYKFADGAGFADVFVPWCAWVCIWAALFLMIFAVTGLCQYITKFTRFSGELFGMLIAILFMQQAIKGVVQEFSVLKCSGENPIDPTEPCEEFPALGRLVNGLWATILAVGTVATSMLIITARGWRFFKGEIRSFLADFGVPLMVVAWSGVSYAIQDATPGGLPRRLSLPNTWEDESQRNWGVAGQLLDVSGAQIAYAMVPALIIALLFYFDHNVSAQLAQQKDFQLVRPTAYHWDLLVLAFLTLLCGLLGIPPLNGVIPQAPMHTKSLVTLKQMLVGRNSVRKSKLHQSGIDSKTKTAIDVASLDAVPVNTRKSHVDLQAAASAAGLSPAELYGNTAPQQVDGATVAKSESSASQDVLAKHGIEREYIHLEDGVVALNVKEQRLSNFIQGALVAVCLGASPAVKRIPKSVLWGYFAYMSLEGLPGSEFWDRILLAFTDKRRRIGMLEKEHPVYLETVTFSNIMKFTALQVAYLCMVWGVTWAGAVGIAFPFLIVLVIPARQYLMPKLFDGWTLSQLDTAEYEQASSAPDWVVEEAKRDAGEPVERTEFEKREALAAEMPGYAGIKHHVTQDELKRRRLSLHNNSLREGVDLNMRSSADGASFDYPYRPSVDGIGPGVFSGTGNTAQDHMESGTGAHRS